MLNLIRCIKGFLLVKIYGYSPERFINLCRNNGILVWDLRVNGSEYYFRISIKDFKNCRTFFKKTGVKAVILKKYGLPFFIHNNLKRKVFFFCIPISLLCLYSLTFFIWSFQFVGNYQLTDDMLNHFLKKNNIKAGSLINSIQIEVLEEKIREEFECITWTSIKIKGTKLIIEIHENDTTKEIQEKRSIIGTDIIAMENGIIVDMVTRNGVPKVKKGDQVKKGDILVEGCVPIYNNEYEIIDYDYCNADADIWIQYEKKIEKKISKYYQYKKYTGRVIRKDYVRIQNCFFSTSLKKIDYPFYDIINDTKKVRLLKDIYLPVSYGTIMYREYVMVDSLYTDKMAEQYLKRKFDKDMKDLREKGVQIIENNVRIYSDGENVKISGNIVLMERNKAVKNTEMKSLEQTENE